MAITSETLKAQAAKAREVAAAAQAEAEALKKEARRLENEERRAKAKAENDAHYAKCLEIGRNEEDLTEAQHAIVYSKAWEDGHSYGYGEVEMHYRNLAEMARKLLDTV